MIESIPIMNPDFEKLNNEVEAMRAELSRLLLERDELEFKICKNIEMEYTLRFGSLEYRVYEAYCNYLRLKRKAELIQAKINRQEKIILPAIEERLDEEFAEYQRKLNAQMEKMNDALKRSRLPSLSAEESKELKKLYHKVVKVLHPDINPNVTEEQKKLLENAVIAYKNGDLASLRVISEMIGGEPVTRQDQNAMAQLCEAKKSLGKHLQTVREQMEKIKSVYPYTMREILDDPELAQQKRRELEESLRQYEILNEAYETRVREMLGRTA